MIVLPPVSSPSSVTALLSVRSLESISFHIDSSGGGGFWLMAVEG